MATQLWSQLMPSWPLAMLPSCFMQFPRQQNLFWRYFNRGFVIPLHLLTHWLWNNLDILFSQDRFVNLLHNIHVLLAHCYLFRVPRSKLQVLGALTAISVMWVFVNKKSVNHIAWHKRENKRQRSMAFSSWSYWTHNIKSYTTLHLHVAKCSQC